MALDDPLSSLDHVPRAVPGMHHHIPDVESFGESVWLHRGVHVCLVLNLIVL
jgi:hypothetical protein